MYHPAGKRFRSKLACPLRARGKTLARLPHAHHGVVLRRWCSSCSCPRCSSTYAYTHDTCNTTYTTVTIPHARGLTYFTTTDCTRSNTQTVRSTGYQPYRWAWVPSQDPSEAERLRPARLYVPTVEAAAERRCPALPVVPSADEGSRLRPRCGLVPRGWRQTQRG